DWDQSVFWHQLENLDPSITQFELAHDFGNQVADVQILDRVTSDPTLVGRVWNDNGVASLTIEFDYDGDYENNYIVDGTTSTDEKGFFQFTPAGLTEGAWDIRARVVEHNPVTGDDLPSGWVHITADGNPATTSGLFYGFTLVPATAAEFDTNQPLSVSAS